MVSKKGEWTNSPNQLVPTILKGNFYCLQLSLPIAIILFSWGKILREISYPVRLSFPENHCDQTAPTLVYKASNSTIKV